MFYDRKSKRSSASGKTKHHETLNVNCVRLTARFKTLMIITLITKPDRDVVKWPHSHQLILDCICP